MPGAFGVLKLDWTCGGKGVRVVRSLAEAEEALGAMRRPANVMTALGRWLMIHDALAIWKWRNQGQHVGDAATVYRWQAGEYDAGVPRGQCARDGDGRGVVCAEHDWNLRSWYGRSKMTRSELLRS